MLKKILAAMLATMLIVTASATALAAPEDTAAPAETASPASTVAPTAPPVDVDAFVAQVKAMRDAVIALKEQLIAEKKLEQKMVSVIHSLKGVYTPDPVKLKAYNAELRVLDNKLKKLEAELRAEQKVTKKHKPDPKEVARLQAEIEVVKVQIAALDEKYAGLKKQMKAEKSARSTLKAFREQLKTEYAKLKPLFQQSNVLKAEMFALVDQMKTAIEAGDIAKATDLLAQVTAKVEALKQNISARIAIRDGIAKMIEEYKANLTK